MTSNNNNNNKQFEVPKRICSILYEDEDLIENHNGTASLLEINNNVNSNNNKNCCSIFQNDKFISCFDLSWTLITLVVFILDILSDLSLAIYYYINENISICVIMIVIIYISSLFTSMFERCVLSFMTASMSMLPN